MYFVAILQPWSLNMVDYGCFDGYKYFTLLNPFFYLMFYFLVCSPVLQFFTMKKGPTVNIINSHWWWIDLPCVFQFITAEALASVCIVLIQKQDWHLSAARNTCTTGSQPTSHTHTHTRTHTTQAEWGVYILNEMVSMGDTEILKVPRSA